MQACLRYENAWFNVCSGLLFSNYVPVMIISVKYLTNITIWFIPAGIPVSDHRIKKIIGI